MRAFLSPPFRFSSPSPPRKFPLLCQSPPPPSSIAAKSKTSHHSKPVPSPPLSNPIPPSPHPSSPPSVILSYLLDRNLRFHTSTLPPFTYHTPPSVLQSLSKAQHPFAVVIACADSRVSPELIFGAQLGQLFVIRNAGNLCSEDSVSGSVEYATGVLGAPLVIVLGHTKCGAVTAAMSKDKIPGRLGRHIGRIKEIVDGEDILEKGIRRNVRGGVKELKEGALKDFHGLVVGAVYDIDTGKVTLLE